MTKDIDTKYPPATLQTLTKREYFAALALQTVLKSSVWIEFSQQAKDRGQITQRTLEVAEENSQIVSDICLKYADALLAQLAKNG